MSRTIKEVRIIGKGLERVRLCVEDWFRENGFKINQWDSNGKPFLARGWGSILGTVVRPKKGSMVATRIDLTGSIVFQVSFREESSDTILHGEFYAAGAEIFVFIELDFKPRSSILGKLPRESGYKLMTDFLKVMNNYSI